MRVLRAPVMNGAANEDLDKQSSGGRRWGGGAGSSRREGPDSRAVRAGGRAFWLDKVGDYPFTSINNLSDRVYGILRLSRPPWSCPSFHPTLPPLLARFPPPPP